MGTITLRGFVSRKKLLFIAASAIAASTAIQPVSAQGVPIALGLTGIAIGVSSLVLKIVGDENAKREGFTKGFVDQASQQYPDYNIVIIHTAHDRSGEFVHQHQELNMDLIGARTIGYEIYFAKKGRPFSLTNKGDGGFINWAYGGDFIRDGSTIRAR
jgi:hypothetical protein